MEKFISNGILHYGGKHYIMEKLSSFSDISFDILDDFSDMFVIILKFTLNFSGEDCTIKSVRIFNKKIKHNNIFKKILCADIDSDEYKLLIDNSSDYIEYCEKCINEDKKPIEKLQWIIERFSLEDDYKILQNFRESVINSIKK